jgi:hypothetical protein
VEVLMEKQAWLLSNPIYFGIFFVAMWCLVCFVISRITGWSRLAEVYRARYMPESKLMRLVQVYWGTVMVAGNIYTVGADNDGLYLAVLFPFRVGHPPLLIPWQDIKAEKVDGFLRPRVRLIFGDEVSRPFEIYEKTAERIKEGSNGRFGY